MVCYIHLHWVYEGVSKSFRTELIKKYTLTTISTRREATQRVMTAKLTWLTHRILIQLHLVAGSYTICSSRARQPVRKLMDISLYDIDNSSRFRYSVSNYITSCHCYLYMLFNLNVIFIVGYILAYWEKCFMLIKLFLHFCFLILY
jgi:hypothetical protein